MKIFNRNSSNWHETKTVTYKDKDTICKQVAAKYSSNPDLLHISPITDGSMSK